MSPTSFPTTDAVDVQALEPVVDRVRRGNTRSRLASTLPWRPVLGMVVFLALLELVPRSGLVDQRYLPPLDAMVRSLGSQVGSMVFWEALGATLRGWAIGLGIAVVAGVVLGFLLGWSRLAREFMTSTVEFFRPIPAVALIPVVLLLMGPNASSTILMVVYASFWQVLIQVIYGVEDTDPVARDVASSFRFSWLETMRFVVWPSSMPYLWTGFRLAASVALIVELTGEMIIRSPGIGRQIALAQSAGAVDELYALVIVAGLIGVVVNLIARQLESRTLHWHSSVTEAGR